MFYGISLSVGIILFVISLFLLKNTMDFLKQSEKVIGKVAALERVNDSDGKDSFKPIFKFTTSRKEEIFFTYNISSSPPDWMVGDEEMIAYDPNNPTSAKLLTYFGTFGWVIILMAIATPFIIAGAGYFAAQQFLR